MHTAVEKSPSCLGGKAVERAQEKPDPHYTPTPVWFTGRRVFLCLLIFCGLIHAMIALIFSLGVAQLFRDMRSGAEALWLDNFGIYTSILFAMALATMLVRTVEREVAERVGQSYVVAMRARLYDHMLHVALRDAQRFSGGSKMLRFVTDLNGLQRWVSYGLSRLLVSLAMLLVIAIALFWLNSVMALVIISALLAGSGLSFLMAVDLPNAIRCVRKYRARLAATVNDRIALVATVQACDQRKRELQRVKKQSEALRRPLIYRARIIGMVRGALEGTGLLASGAALACGAYLVNRNELAIADVVALVILVGLLAQPLRDLARVLEYWHDWRVSHDKISRFFAQPTERKNNKIRRLPDGPGLLETKSLCIDDLLFPISLQVQPGEKILLRGDNGAGKSTLLYTLAGIIAPTSGKVTIDNYDVHRRRCLRGSGGIAIVSSDLGLMRGTLRRNLTYGFAQAEDEQLALILKQCGLKAWVDSLPKRLNTRISESGKNLSLGRRQLLLLARALLTKPRLLLLDEFDAHIDASARAKVEKLLLDFPGAIIRVSHDTIDTGPYIKIWQLSDKKITVINKPCRSYFA